MTTFGLIDKAFALKKCPLFEDLDLEMLLAITDHVGAVSFNEGEKIFHIEEEDTRGYIIVEGSVQICNTDDEPIATLTPSEFFGDEALFSATAPRYQATATTDCLLLTLSRSTLYTIIAEYPTIALKLLQHYAKATPFRQRQTEEASS